MRMADSRTGRLLAAVLDEHGSRLKPVLKDYGKREALNFVDPGKKMNLLQMSVIVGNISAGDFNDVKVR